MSPAVSICIPAFERPDFLVRTLESVLKQSYEDYEVIITDDSRNDSVERAVSPYRGSSRLHYFKNEKNLGAPANWNAAMRHAKGKYIKILHHDDWFAGPESLGKMVRLLDENPAFDFAFCASSARGSDGNEKFIHSPSPSELEDLRRDYRSLFPRNIIGAPSATLFRNSVGLVFDEKMKWVVDIDFYLGILERNPLFVYVAEPLVCISSGVEGQVTDSCAGNPDVELFEWVYLYQKLNRQPGIDLRQLRFLHSLFSRLDPVALPEAYRERTGKAVPPTVRLLIALRSMMNAVSIRKRS